MDKHAAPAPHVDLHRIAPIPPLFFSRDPDRQVPDEAGCAALWDKYGMPEHIRAHSRLVTDIAVTLAEALEAAGADIHVPSVRASALLHDLGKIYSIEHGGSHAQLGAAWVMAATRNPHIAQGVIQHVRWIWDVDVDDDRQLLTLSVLYADKRVRHDQIVSLEERFEDIMARYGRTERARQRITAAAEQGRVVEAALARRLGKLPV